MKLRLLIFINLICIGLGIGLGPFLAAFQFDPNASQAKWNVYFYIVMSSASSLLLNPFGLFLALYCERLEAKLRKRMSFVFFLINLLLALFWGLTEFVRFPPAENTTYPHHSAYLTWLFVAAWLALAAGYFACYRSEARDLESLSEAEQQQSEWSLQISKAAAQQERNRLARDLHDSIKQQIFSINVSAATAQARFENDPTGAQTALETVRESAREAMVEMEAMLQHLRPAPLETVGLIEALRKQGEALQYRTGAQVVMEFDALPDNDHLPPGAQEALFRIAQEAFTNIARHARARTVQMRLEGGQDETLRLKISDDGQGFDTRTALAGMGLSNIRARAQEIGGTVQIETAPLTGTHLVIGVPLVMTDFDRLKFHVRLGSFWAFLLWLIIWLQSFLISKDIFISDWFRWDLSLALLVSLMLISYVKGHRAYDRMVNLKLASPKTALEVKRYMQQCVTAPLAFTWLLVCVPKPRYYPASKMDLWAFVGMILIPLFFGTRELHRTLKKQQALLSPEEFGQSLQRMWRQTLLFLSLLLLLIVGLHIGTGSPLLWLEYIGFLGYLGFVHWWRKQGATS